MERYDDTKEKIQYLKNCIRGEMPISFKYKGREIKHFRTRAVKNTNSLHPDFYAIGVFKSEKLYKYSLKFMTEIIYELEEPEV